MSAQKSKARIGIIGTGWWTTYVHLPALQGYDGAEVAAITNRSEDRLNQAGDTFGINKRYTDYRKMLDNEDLDGVIVAVTHTAHYDIAREVLGRKIALMLEKPMVLRAREAREINSLAEQNNVPLIIGYPWHYVPQHRQLKEMIAAGRIGEIQLVDSLFASMVVEYYRANPEAYADVFKWSVMGPRPSTYSDPKEAGGGQAHLQMTHSAGLLLWLTGLRPVEVAAFMENWDVAVDLCDAVSVRFHNKAVGTLASTGAIPAKQQPNSQLEYRIFGTEAYVLLDAIAGTCNIYYNDGKVETLEQTPAERRYPQEMTSRNLVDVILGRDENRSTGEVGMRVVELLDAAYVSATERRIVRVEEL